MDQPPPTERDRRPDQTPPPLEAFSRPPPNELFVGIDVSPEWVDAARGRLPREPDPRGPSVRQRGPGFQLLWDETQKLGAKFTAT